MIKLCNRHLKCKIVIAEAVAIKKMKEDEIVEIETVSTMTKVQVIEEEKRNHDFLIDSDGMTAEMIEIGEMTEIGEIIQERIGLDMMRMIKEGMNLGKIVKRGNEVDSSNNNKDLV